MSQLDTARPDAELEDGDHDRHAHYALKDDITRAYIEGTPVIALCGKVWVPNRDPEKFPVCPECKRLLDLGPEGRREEFERRASE